MSFYYSNIGWDTENCPSGLEISGSQENIVTIKKSSNPGYTIYHKNWYHSQLKGFVSFKIKIGRLQSRTDGYYGFASCNNIIDGRFYTNEKQSCYALQGNTCLWAKWNVTDDSNIDENAETLQQGDEATFTLDLTEAKIYLSKNGGQKKAIFQNIETGEKIKYKFATTFFTAYSGDFVTITDVEDFTSEY